MYKTEYIRGKNLKYSYTVNIPLSSEAKDDAKLFWNAFLEYGTENNTLLLDTKDSGKH